MRTSTMICRQIFYYVEEGPFSIRDFLDYGSRAAVDQTFYRLVKAGRLIRVARGVYLKSTAPFPSTLAVAKVKAAAFCRVIAVHGGRAAQALHLTEDKSFEHTYAISGRTSSFQFNGETIRLIGTAARKLYFGDSPIGLAVRALWHLGNQNCDPCQVAQATWEFGRSDRATLKQSGKIMPAWMRENFASLNKIA
jgi:hypothetical protein